MSSSAMPSALTCDEAQITESRSSRVSTPKSFKRTQLPTLPPETKIPKPSPLSPMTKIPPSRKPRRRSTMPTRTRNSETVILSDFSFVERVGGGFSERCKPPDFILPLRFSSATIEQSRYDDVISDEVMRTHRRRRSLLSQLMRHLHIRDKTDALAESSHSVKGLEKFSQARKCEVCADILDILDEKRENRFSLKFQNKTTFWSIDYAPSIRDIWNK